MDRNFKAGIRQQHLNPDKGQNKRYAQLQIGKHAHDIGQEKIERHHTADARAELSGTLDRFGYYMTAGHLRSDGLSAYTGANQNNLYGKFTYLLPDNGTATFGLSHLKSQPGLDEADTTNWGFIHDNNEYRRTNAFLKFTQRLGNKLTLDIGVFLTDRDDHTKFGGRDGQGAITFFNDYTASDSSRGANARLT